jgi:hypothetical protein
VSAATGDDPFGVGPAGEPRRPERAVGIAAPVIVALVAWVVVGAIELVDVPNVSVGALAVPVVEAAVWAAAVIVTVYVVWRVRRGGAVLGVLAALFGGAAFATSRTGRCSSPAATTSSIGGALARWPSW